MQINTRGSKVKKFLMTTSISIICIIIVKITLIASKVSEQQAKSYFAQVLFIVKYNFLPSANHVLLHNRLWGRVFKNRHYILPRKTNDNSVADSLKSNNISFTICNDLTDTDKCNGYLAYKGVITVMSSHPNYKGYLFAHDDMAMNITNLMDFDLTSFASANTKSRYWLVQLDDTWENRNHSWVWFNRPNGIPAMQSFLSTHPYLGLQIKRCTGSQRAWYRGLADFFYVPQKQKQLYSSIMEKLGSSKVFLEIAIPTFFMCFVPIGRLVAYEVCTSHFHGERSNISFYQKNCRPSASHIHPVKLSSERHINFVKEFMDIQ